MFGTYDSWKTTEPQPDPPYRGPVGPTYPRNGGCPVCDGGNGSPCSAACLEVALRATAGERLRNLRRACRQAIRLLRAYRAEGDGLGSPRLLATLARVGELRAEMRKAAARARPATPLGGGGAT